MFKHVLKFFYNKTYDATGVNALVLMYVAYMLVASYIFFVVESI